MTGLVWLGDAFGWRGLGSVGSQVLTNLEQERQIRQTIMEDTPCQLCQTMVAVVHADPDGIVSLVYTSDKVERADGLQERVPGPFPQDGDDVDLYQSSASIAHAL